jgi:hypothetical protein
VCESITVAFARQKITDYIVLIYFVESEVFPMLQRAWGPPQMDEPPLSYAQNEACAMRKDERRTASLSLTVDSLYGSLKDMEPASRRSYSRNAHKPWNFAGFVLPAESPGSLCSSTSGQASERSTSAP